MDDLYSGAVYGVLNDAALCIHYASDLIMTSRVVLFENKSRRVDLAV